MVHPATLIFISYGTSFVLSASYTNNPDADISAVAGDWNNDGASDLWIQNASGNADDTEILFNYTPELISSVTNGLGIATMVTYDRLNKNLPLYNKCPNNPPSTPPNYICGDTYPTQAVDGPVYVVSRIDSSTGVAACTPSTLANCYSSTYAYAGAKADLKGRGFLGFSSVTVTDLQSNVVQTTNYALQFPLTGLALSQTKTHNGIAFSTVTNTYFGGTGACGTAPTGPVYTVYLCKSVGQSNELDTAGVAGPAMPTVETDYANYDAYGNVGTVTASTTPPGGSAADVVKTTTNTWLNTVDASHWLLGRLLEADVDSATSGSLASPDIVRQSAYTYDTNSGLLLTETVEPHQSAGLNDTVTTTYQYDGFGNKHLVTVQGFGSPAPVLCTTETDYDTRGEFPVKVTNCMVPSESETWTFDLPANQAFGHPHTHTGPNGLTTTWSYDTFGRKTQDLNPDGTRTSVSYAYCTSVLVLGTDTSCTPLEMFSTATSTMGSDGSTQIAPNTRTYFDGLSRPVTSDAQGFDGSWIRSDTVFDKNGRVVQADRPYFLQNPAQTPCGSGTVCATTTYDDLGRVIKVLQPDGGYTKTTYAGLSTSVLVHIIHPDTTSVNETTISTKNDLGVPASMTDALDGNDPGHHTTTYAYDALGELLSVVDPLGRTVTTNQYDLRGRKVCSVDLDMGAGSCATLTNAWVYSYDALGRLVSQTDPKGQVATMSYDVLGRMTARTEPDMVTAWTYGTGANQATYPNSIDKAVVVSCTGTSCGTGGASGSYSRTYQYDTLGRQSQLTTQVGASSYYTTSGYDGITGKLVNTRAFSGFTLHYAYNIFGYQMEIDDGTNYAIAYWKANQRDAELHLLSQTTGNVSGGYAGLTTTNAFDPLSGRLTQTFAGPSNAVASLSYDWDTAGNLWDRGDLNASWQSEHFCTDVLNRLTYANFGASCGGSGRTAITYDAAGNILTKSDTGTYSYAGTGPHALSAIAGTVNGVLNPTFAYDADGAMISGAGRTVSYTGFNMTKQVSEGATTVSLSYDTEHGRSRQVSTVGGVATTTIYLNDPAANVMSENTRAGSNPSQWKTYILAGGAIVAERVTTTGGTPAPFMRYFVLDHLGSVSVVTDENGAVVSGGRQSYDAWGRERNADGSADTGCALPAQSQTTRGFTSQEEMPSVCLVNMNARLYDPQIGRFMAADSVVQNPYDAQDLNRYTYVVNNPLSETDPTGNCHGMLECVGDAYLDLVVPNWVLRPTIRQYPVVGSALTIAAAIECYAICAALSAAEVAGITTGDAGKAFEAFALTYAEAGAFSAIGDLHIDTSSVGGLLESAGYHGFVGGLTSMAQGGRFGSGFIAAAFSDIAAPDPATTNEITGAVRSAIAGGVGSRLGGGKFADGAVTGAFGYLFNEFSHLWYGTDAHYSIEHYFESKDPAFAGELQVGLNRVDLAYVDEQAQQITIFEIKADTRWSHIFGGADAQIDAYIDKLTTRFPGFQISVGTEAMVAKYYQPGSIILSNSVPGRYYDLAPGSGKNGIIYYGSYGSDPFGEAVLKGLSHPVWGIGVPRWPSRDPRYGY